ncbi:hypothetical protein [Nonomuraea salmonea]
MTLNFHPDRLVGELAIRERLAKDTTPEPWGTPEIVRCSEWTS